MNSRKPLIIQASDKEVVRGNFNSEIRDSILYIPKRFADILHQNGYRTAEDLISYIQTFPTSVANILQWTMSDVAEASDRLYEQLKGQINDDFLRPHPRKGFGARDPNEIS